MAELLNQFFSSVFPREDVQNIPTATEMGAPVLETVGITNREVKIKNLRPSSAAGPDGIGPQLLQKL